MKKTRLLNFLRVTFLLLIFSAFSSSSWAATITGGVTLYFDASGSDWKADNARFAAYLCNGSSIATWYSLEQVEGDIYSFTVTSGESHNNVIFCRMDPNNPTNDWGAKWNQTGDLVWDGSKNLFKPNSKHNNKNTGTWSTYEEEDLPDALPDAVVCGKKTTLFFEDFGTLDGEKNRKQNNQIDGQNFYTSYNYIAECAKIKNAGEYAIVATPRYSGCSSKQDKDYENTCACGNSDTGKWWYNENYDHTDDDGDGNPYNDAGNGLYGGMLQFDCRNGSSTDVLYQRTVSGVCSNTLVNFSAWVTKANISGADPIKARFILRKGGADGTIIGRKDIDDIKIDEGWKQISAMFNSDTLNTDGEITIQLINLAPYGKNGNDILLDDLELSVCTPKASLVCSDGTSTEKILLPGESEELTASIVNGVMTNPFYYWLYYSNRTGWMPLEEPQQGLVKYTVTPGLNISEYKVIITQTPQEAYDIASDRNNVDACGMYAVTNLVTLETKNLNLTTELSDDNICADGVDENTLTLTVKNTIGITVSNVKVKVNIPTEVTSVSVAEDSGYSNGVWTIGTIANNATAELKLTLKSATTLAVASKDVTINSFISGINSLTYNTYEDALVKKENILTVKAITTKPSVTDYANCPIDGSINLADLVDFSPKTGLNFYNKETGALITNSVINVNNTNTTDLVRNYLVSNTLTGECESEKADLKVTVYGQPTASLSGSTTICNGGSANLNIQLNGKANYSITLSNGEVKPDVSGNTAQMTVSPDVTTTYTIRSVIDGNGCEATTSGSAKVTVNEKPVIEFTENPLPEYCAGVEYTLPAPTVDNKGANITESGWYLADDELTNSKIKFTTEDNAKSLVYKAKNICGETTATFVTSLNVADCAQLTLSYQLDKSSYCEGDDAVLTATLYNGSALDLDNVEVRQSWAGKQSSVLSEVSKGTYTNNIWSIGKLTQGETVTLTISFNVEEAEVFKIYVSAANGETYTFDNSVEKSTAQLVVKSYSDNVTVNNYAKCPINANSFLITDLVTSDNNDLKVWTKNAATGLYEKLDEVPTIDPKQTLPATTYYITNTERGKCESTTPTAVTVEVFPQPTATLSGDATICNGEPAYLAIKLFGTKDYTITYTEKVGNTTTDKLLENVDTDNKTISVSPTTTTTYALKEVIDGNSCKATLTGNVEVVVNDKAEISISAPEPICAGDPLDLTNKVTIVTNGSTVTNGNWYLDDAIYTEGSPVLYEKNGAILKYKATSSCGGTIESTNSFAIIVKAKANITITAPADLCIQNPLQLQTPTINYNGSTVTGGKWYLDGEEYNGADLVYKDEAYTLQYKATSSCGGETKSNEVTFKVKDKPTINLTEVDLGELCAGTELDLPTVTTKENNSTISSQGWLLETSSITSPIDALSTDVHDGKTITYTATNECGTTKVDYTTLSVKDCADFTLTFDLDNSNPCSEDEVTLTATITNNGGSDLSNVVLSLQGPNAQASVTSSTSGDIVSNYSAGVWTIPTFTSKATATLTIKFSAQASEELKIHVSESNGVSYASYAESPAKDTEELVVKEISDDVEISDNYIMCPTESSSTMFLSDFVISNQDGLKYFDKNADGTYTALTSEPTFDTSLEFASHTYYITNTETGKCESTTPTPITIEIYKPVKASISGLSPLCSGETSNVSITLEGTPEFTVVYNNGTADITQKTSETTLNIAESLSSTTTYKLVSVTDINNCSAYLNGIEFVTVTVNPRPELVSFEIEDSDDIICEGESTNLKATFTGTAPFTFKINGEEKTSDANEWSMTISDAKEYVITDLSDANCSAETISNNSVTLTVDALPVVTLSATDVTLNCTTPTATITASGAYKYEWSYLDQTGATQTKSGSTLALQQTDPEVSSLVTEYTVYGYSENANCQSVEAKTVKVTEDFVKPVASIKVSERTDGTIQEWLDCNQETIKLEADITLNTVTLDKYIWSDGSEADNTIINKADTYTLQVVGKNGCKSEVATKTIAENIIKPQVSIDSYVKDPITGEIATQTKLTCTNKEITLDGKINNADEYSENYPNGEFTYLWSDGATTSSTVARTSLASSPMEYTLIVTAPNGCDNSTDKAKVTITEDVTQPVLDIKEVYELCPSDTLSAKTLSSLLPKTSGITYKFYDESDVEIADLYKTSTENYYVVGVSENGCESEKVSFAVDLAKNVDFTLTASQTSMLVGGNETVITIIPNAESDEADTYTWQANGNEIAVDGLEYSTNLYLDTKFEVTATNRCDSKSQEVSIEVLWPTAFTPHNGNGKNDDFAKGMPIIVFNRFYTKIFEGPDGWDGTINGTMNDSKNIAVPGVYYYKVDLPNGEVKKGTIEIVR